MTRVRGSLAICAMLALAGCATDQTSTNQTAVNEQASTINPREAGDRAPSATLRTPSGDPFDIADSFRQQPTALVFYRGGWCPYCNTHLAELAQIEPTLREMGFQMLAVSPDRPEELRESIDEQGLDYQLLSDQDMTLARSFGIAFQVDEQTRKAYDGYGIDLAAASGRSHYELPVPAVYLIDRNGMIRFVHWDEDYKQRLSGDALLDAAAEMQR